MSPYSLMASLVLSAAQVQNPSNGQASPAFRTKESATRGALELISLTTDEILRT